MNFIDNKIISAIKAITENNGSITVQDNGEPKKIPLSLGGDSFFCSVLIFYYLSFENASAMFRSEYENFFDIFDSDFFQKSYQQWLFKLIYDVLPNDQKESIKSIPKLRKIFCEGVFSNREMKCLSVSKKLTDAFLSSNPLKEIELGELLKNSNWFIDVPFRKIKFNDRYVNAIFANQEYISITFSGDLTLPNSESRFSPNGIKDFEIS